MVTGRKRRGRGMSRFAGRLLLVAGGLSLSCTPGTMPSTAVTPSRSRPAADAWADSALATLSLRDRVAQLVWPWILGDYVPTGSTEWQRLTTLVTAEHVGGFIVSVGAPMDIAAKVNALQQASRLPLLISADLETGVGFRARGGYFVPNAIDLGGATTFPLQMALGAIGDSALAYEEARVTAREGRALGMHIAFGPVLDVNNNPANPVIGARSISEDPGVAARLGSAMVRGLQENGMLATGKHFPGHGDTETNSHLALSVVTASRARLDSVELTPFRAAIRAGAGAIMTFHGYLPALDSTGVPATLSSNVMTELLRHELQFDGLLITDAMDMAGVVSQYGAYEASRRALLAGADVLLMPADTRGTIDSVVSAVNQGRIPAARIDASARRVLRLKAQFGLERRRLVSLDSVRMVVGDSSHVALAQAIADRSVVLVKDSLQLVPLRGRMRGGRVLSVTYARRADLGAGTIFGAEIRRGGGLVQSIFVSADETTPVLTDVLGAADSADVVILGNYVNISSTSSTAAAPPGLAALVSGLQARTPNLILVAFGSPYALMQTPMVPAYMVAWGGMPVTQRAAARALLGDIGISATLPISIPPLFPRGAGERRPAPSRIP